MTKIKIKSKEELIQEVKLATMNELQYMASRFCGPSNICLREKHYTYDACKFINRIIQDEIANRSFDELFVSDT